MRGPTRYARPVIALASILALGCAAPPEEAPERGGADADRGAPGPGSVAEQRLGGFVGIAEASEMLADPATVLLEVGTDREAFEAGHIEGARFLSFGSIVAEVGGLPNQLPPVERLDSVFEAAGVSDGSTVLVYGPPLRAARAAMTLAWLGLGGRTYILEADAEAWAAAGGDVEGGTPDVAPGVLTPAPVDDLVVDADWIAARLDASGVRLLDARPPEQHSGEVAGDGVERPGHIPGSVPFWWEEMTEGTEPLDMPPPSDLRARFAERGFEPGDTIVTYCRTGVQASMAWAVAEDLGYEVRIYDASFTDWSRRPTLAVTGPQ